MCGAIHKRLEIKNTREDESKAGVELTLLSSFWFPNRAWYFLYLPWRYLFEMK